MLVVDELRQEFPLRGLLKLAGLAKSTFYYRKNALRVGERHVELKTAIREIFIRHKGRYGYRRITATIRNTGSTVNHKTVQRLMCEMKLKCLVRAKKYRSYRGAEGLVAPNLMNRQFSAARPNEKWATDVTEFNVGGAKLYLSPILDLFNGEIVSYEIAERPLFTMIQSMLTKAFAKLVSTDKPMLHSDQGWQYKMPIYRRLLAAQSITPSMSRKGNCLDNASIESFFGTLKSEYFYLNKFTSIDQLRSGLREYIQYYNAERIKLKLRGLSPIQYRMMKLQD